MKINLEINNLTQSPIENISFEKIAEEILREVANFLSEKEVSLSMAWIGEDEMKKLNSAYRQKEAVTDILSFPEFKNLEEIRQIKEKKIFLGELILCYDDIEKYAKQEGLNLKEELTKVFAHGLLHLLGFDHGKEMFSFQERIIAKTTFIK